jgi:flagellar motor switch protein FliN
MNTYLECWAGVASSLFHQALAGEPNLVEWEQDAQIENSFGMAVTITGDESGVFAIWLDSSILDEPLLGEGVEQRASWVELLRETFEAACGELFAKTGKKCRVQNVNENENKGHFTRAFQIRSGQRGWGLLVRDELSARNDQTAEEKKPEERTRNAEPAVSALRPGLELLLDVELEASLRFGCREMPLGEILDLGPGDVVQLDRHVADPVDLIVGDKIVARGEVVLVNGNFGLRISEVAAPIKRLESIRCLF